MMLKIAAPSIKRLLQVFLPLGVLTFFASIITLMYFAQPEPKSRKESVKKTQVFTENITVTERRLRVMSQGEVNPKASIELRNEVEGKILSLSPAMVAGGRFQKGEVLIEIEPFRYELDVVQRQARVAQTEQQYVKAKAESTTAIQELEAMGRDNASELAKGLPQLRQAEAALASARAELALAKLELSYTKIIAPFEGRVRSETLTVGQYLTRNSKMAEVFSTQVMEIRLALTTSQIEQLGLPPAFFSTAENSPFDVRLLDDLESGHQWHAKIVRTEAVVDRRTRAIYAVAEIKQPYQAEYPLLAGSFVQAEILGDRQLNVAEIPVRALRNGRDLWLVDDDNKLNIVQPLIVQRARDRVLVQGVESGSRVITSTLPIPTQGMPLAIVGAGDTQVARSEAVDGETQDVPRLEKRKKKSSLIKKKTFKKGGV